MSGQELVLAAAVGTVAALPVLGAAWDTLKRRRERRVLYRQIERLERRRRRWTERERRRIRRAAQEEQDRERVTAALFGPRPGAGRRP